MYINYDKTTHNPIEKSVSSINILSTLSHSVLLLTSHSTHAANTNYCTTDESMESI